MADQWKSDFCVDFTMSPCALELKQTLISLPFEVTRLLNQINRLSVWLLGRCWVHRSFLCNFTNNHMLERGSKVFSCFLDVRKAFDTVWLDGLLNKSFTELGIGGRMWLAIKDLYTGVKALVLYSGSFSRQFSVSQGTRQGRILAPFMYKVYINALLIALSNHAYALNINGLSLPSPPFADDISLLAIQPSFLRVFMQMCSWIHANGFLERKL